MVKSVCVKCGREWTPSPADPVFGWFSGTYCKACSTSFVERLWATYGGAKR